MCHRKRHLVIRELVSAGGRARIQSIESLPRVLQDTTPPFLNGLSVELEVSMLFLRRPRVNNVGFAGTGILVQLLTSAVE